MVAATREKPVALKPPTTVGEYIEQMSKLHAEAKELNAKVKKLDDQFDALSDALKQKLIDDGMTKASGSRATVSVYKSDVGNVTDYDEFNAFVKKHGFFQFYQRRFNYAAIYEVLGQGKKVPGFVPVEVQKLRFTPTA